MMGPRDIYRGVTVSGVSKADHSQIHFYEVTHLAGDLVNQEYLNNSHSNCLFLKYKNKYQ